MNNASNLNDYYKECLTLHISDGDLCGKSYTQTTFHSEIFSIIN
jgi:hypothetical protein